ncbi:MAG: hypothetical protein HQL76_14515 [Magnetococcales bacterium]|nr:hypothetical protein [Magnetococcales bacterium]
MLGKMAKRGVFAILLGLSVSLSSGGYAQEAEKPFSDDEINRFMVDYGAMIQEARKRQGNQSMPYHPWTISGMRYDKGFVAQLTAKGWKPDRFFYIFNHVNQGLMIRKTDQERALAEKKMQDEMQKLAEQSRSRNEAARKEMAEAARQRQSWMAGQLDQEERRIRDNSNIPPFQKAQALGMLQQQRRQLAQSSAATATPTREQIDQSRKKAIRDNPFIPPMQKQWLLQQFQGQQAKSDQTASAASPDARSQRDQMLRQQKEWIARQQAMVANNPYIPPQQRSVMKRQLDQYVRNMELQMQQNPSNTGFLPEEEMKLVEKYGDRLLDMLQKKQ